MKITTDDVLYMSKLSKIKFTNPEAEKLRDEFEDILTHFDNLDKEDLTGFEMNMFINEKSVLREDKMEVFEDKKELFQNAKKTRGTHLEIPKVIE